MKRATLGVKKKNRRGWPWESHHTTHSYIVAHY